MESQLRRERDCPEMEAILVVIRARRSEIPYAYADFSIWPSLISHFSVNFSFYDLFLYG